MILHKYYNKFGLDTLINLEIKVNIPSGFNDPFEFLPKNPVKLSLQQAKKYLKNKSFNEELFQEYKRHGIIKNKKEFKVTLKQNKYRFAELISNKFTEEYFWNLIIRMRAKEDEISRIACFSSEEANEMEQILLWSHYTDKHSGMRFHFNSELLVNPHEKLIKVNYELFRPILDTTLDQASIQFQQQLLESFHTKLKVWEYEKEYRWFVFPTKCISKIVNGENMFFHKFDPKSLIRIDIGVNCSKSTEDVLLNEIEITEKSYIKVFRAKINPEEYKLDYIEIN